METLKTIIPAVVFIIGAVIGGLLIPFIKTRLGTERFEMFKKVVKEVVKCAEQIFVGDKKGKEKKAFVVDWVKKKFPKIDDGVLDVLIESAVLGLNQIGKELYK